LSTKHHEVELGAGQLNATVAATHIEAVGIDGEIGEPAGAPGRGIECARAAQQRTKARQQLLQLIRLDQVVIGPHVETTDAVVDRVARGEQQDRDLVAVGS
jgi:hypothetical protein